ncbi:hypothetical protein ADL28_15085 [Streptomyces violaceusniger]|uniref:Uncharacterized protein n=1 Tax=Streptomyces violaceusniger TaxID=68280 RepID=A0A0X3WY50_STRVO|nr:hypothetical protein ADL28_15085 [Streptomyces violaceusniger]
MHAGEEEDGIAREGVAAQPVEDVVAQVLHGPVDVGEHAREQPGAARAVLGPVGGRQRGRAEGEDITVGDGDGGGDERGATPVAEGRADGQVENAGDLLGPGERGRRMSGGGDGAGTGERVVHHAQARRAERLPAQRVIRGQRLPLPTAASRPPPLEERSPSVIAPSCGVARDQRPARHGRFTQGRRARIP